MPIHAVIFDLGRVLVHVNTQALWDFFFRQSTPEDTQHLMIQIMSDPMMEAYSLGQMTSDAFYDGLCRRYGLALSYDEFAFRWCDIFSVMNGMEEIVHALAGQVRLGLLSDTDPLHWTAIRKSFPLMRYFPKPTLSFEIGSLKPSGASYLAAARNVEVAPRHCLFIDDLQKNVDGAAAAGMKAVRFEGASALRSCLAGLGFRLIP